MIVDDERNHQHFVIQSHQTQLLEPIYSQNNIDTLEGSHKQIDDEWCVCNAYVDSLAYVAVAHPISFTHDDVKVFSCVQCQILAQHTLRVDEIECCS